MQQIEITEEFIKDINDLLNIYDSYDTERKEDITVTITKDILIEINSILFCISSLKEKGITKDNYQKKVLQYFKFSQKALEEYGIDLGITYPFSNPSELYLRIDGILINNNLTAVQRKQFYQETEIRDRIPNQVKSNKKIKCINDWRKAYLQCKDKPLSSEEFIKQELKWNSLTIAEQNLELGITDEEYQEQLEMQQIEQQYFQSKQDIIQSFKKLKYTSK